MKTGRWKKIWFALSALLLLAALGCGLALRAVSSRLLSQREAERWRGENEREFCPVSFFMPRDSAVWLKDISTFRYAVLD